MPKHIRAALPAVVALLAGAVAEADVVTDWNDTAAATAADTEARDDGRVAPSEG